MTTGIKATNSKNVKVINCTFSGLDIDIELDNVDGFASINNRFSQNDPKVIISNLYREILDSNLSEDDKKLLFREVVCSLQDNLGNNFTVRQKLIQSVGEKALDYFLQLAVAVSAGLIIRRI